MKSIFISYRRGDSIATAGRIRDRLVQAFGRSRVFVDIDDIPVGQDFVKILETKLAQSRVLLAIIGPSWLDAKDEDGNRRISDPNDFVGLELASALSKGDTIVIPVLVDGARMPTESQLPDPLKLLARRNAIELRNTQFTSDADRLIVAVKAAMGGRRIPMVAIAGAGIAVAAVLAAVGYLMLAPDRGPSKQASVAPAATAAIAGSSQATAPAKGSQVAAVETPKRPAAPTPVSAAAVDPPMDPAAAIARLRTLLGPAEGRVQVKIRDGNRLKLGDQIVFDITSEAAGRLILIDVNASGEVTQLFPNRFVASDIAARIPAKQTISVPGAGYGFTGFKAVEPAGRGKLIALVVPEGAAADQLAVVREQTVKGFEPIGVPGGYFAEIVEHVAKAGREKGAAPMSAWAFAVTEYEIVK